MPKVYLLTGSNQGPGIEMLNLAAQHVQVNIGPILKRSSLYKTAPWGNTNQQDFLNQVLVVETALTPLEVLKQVLFIETGMGRVRQFKWAPRTIDIDVLFYDNRVVNEVDLQVPHPLLHQRRFTLIPLVEIDPHFMHPTLQLSMAELLENCKDNGIVEKL